MSSPLLSHRDYSSLAETAYLARTIDRHEQLPELMKVVGSFVPYEYSVVGHFSLNQHDGAAVGHSTYKPDFCHMYMSQALAVDPSVQLLHSTRLGLTSSLDDPRLLETNIIKNLKDDYGIKTCFSLGVRGIRGACTYLAFSNFRPRELTRMKMVMAILGPHLHLCYMRISAKHEELETPGELPVFTAREHETMKWVEEGKTNWEISVIMQVSLNTVKFHLKNIFQKLNVDNRCSALARWQWTVNHLLISHPATDHSSTTQEKRIHLTPP